MVAQANETVASRITISANRLLDSPPSASRPMITAVPARPSIAPASLSSVAGSCRVMPQVIRKAKIGVVEASTTVGAAGTYCCAQEIIRNGIVELMVCWKANSFQALMSVGMRRPRAYRIVIRKAAAISERAEMKVIGGIEPE